jgi:DNA-binding MarR family transcriptional regulator
MAEWSDLVANALGALPRPPDMVQMLSDAALPRPEWSVLATAHLCEPPFSLDTLANRMPYASPALLQARVGALVTKGFLQEVAAHEFILTDQAADLIRRWVERERENLAGLATLPQQDLERLAGLLSRVVTAALAAPPPPDKERLLGSRRLAPASTAAPTVRIDQYLTDLYWFRDDAHAAAWRKASFNSVSIEVLTLLWRGEAHDVDGLSAALAERRGYTRDDYASCVQILAERGLVDASQPALTVTAAGRALREQIEATTDEYYMFPWTVLLPVELKQLRDLLQRFTASFRQP